MKRPILRGMLLLLPPPCEEEEEDWCWLRMEAAKAQVEPLPLVPATWRMLRRFRSEGWKGGLV